METDRMQFECIVCRTSDSPQSVNPKVKGDESGMLKVVRCRVCHHTQTTPAVYDIEFYNKDGQVNFVVHNYGTPLEKILEHSWIEAGRRVKRFADYDIGPGEGGAPWRVIDVGGGYGFFGSEMKRCHPSSDVLVMEPGEGRAQMGEAWLQEHGDHHPVPRFSTRLLDEAFVAENAGAFDLVTLWHVVEHVPDPVALLRSAIAIAKPGTGLVCVEVPNLDDELMTLSPEFGQRSFMLEHISYFTPHTLQAAALRAAPSATVSVHGYQRYGILNYFHWIHFNAPQRTNPDMFPGKDRWWLEASWRAAREQARTSDASS